MGSAISPGLGLESLYFIEQPLRYYDDGMLWPSINSLMKT